MRRQAKAGARPASTGVPLATGAPARGRRWLQLVAIVLLFAGSLTAYWNSLSNPLVFDDRALREDLLSYYATATFHFDLRWLSYASFGWIRHAFGANWFWQRLVNVLLHGAVAAILFTLVARVAALTSTRNGGDKARAGTDARLLAFFGALLFLLHPVAVYGVAYLVQRSILLATLFSLASLRFFLEGLQRRSSGWHLAAGLAYFAAVYSKEHAVMLPAVAVALAVLLRGGTLPPLRELALPLALYAAVATLVTLKALGRLGEPYEPFVQTLLPQLQESRADFEAAGVYSLSVVNQTYLYFRYLLVWCLPYTGWMSVDLRTPFPSGVAQWPYVAALFAYGAYPVAAFALLRRRGSAGLLGFGLLAPWLLALTELVAVRIQEPFVLYRSYLWMGLFIGVLPLLLSRLAPRQAVIVLAVACLALVPAVLDRLATFSSAVRLWEDAILKQDDSRSLLAERAWHNRGFALLQAAQYAEALSDFDRAIGINPRDADAYLGRGVLRGRTGAYPGALADLDRAIALDPRYAEAYAKRCFTRMMLGRPSEAVGDCERAIALDPRHRDAHTNLGVVYAALGRTADAEASYRRALAIDPGNGDASYNYGVLLSATGRAGEARHMLNNACRARITAACRLPSEPGRAR